MKKQIVYYSAQRMNREEMRSGYRFPGKIVAAAEWRGKKEPNEVYEGEQRKKDDIWIRI